MIRNSSICQKNRPPCHLSWLSLKTHKKMAWLCGPRKTWKEWYQYWFWSTWFCWSPTCLPARTHTWPFRWKTRKMEMFSVAIWTKKTASSPLDKMTQPKWKRKAEARPAKMQRFLYRRIQNRRKMLRRRHKKQFELKAVNKTSLLNRSHPHK